MPQSLGQMSLADTHWTTEDYGFLTLNKLAGSQVVYILGRHFGVKIEIKRFKALLFLKVRLGNPASQPLVSSVLHLILKKQLKELDKTQYILSCKARLPQYRIAVEFRHNSWVNEKNIQRTLNFFVKMTFPTSVSTSPRDSSQACPP